MADNKEPTSKVRAVRSSASGKVLQKVRIVGIAYVDLDGQILRCNEEFGRIQGDDPTHLTGRNVIDLTSPEDRDRARVNLKNLAEGSTEYVIHEKAYVNRSGETVHCRCQFIRTGDHITSFVYEFNPTDSHTDRIRQLEKYIGELLEIISRSNGINLKVTGTDNSVNANADNQSQASNTFHQIPPRDASGQVLWVVLALVAVYFVVRLLSE